MAQQETRTFRKHWLYTATAPGGRRAQGVVQASDARQALEVIGREFPQLGNVRILNMASDLLPLEEAARQRFGVPPDEVTPQQWADLAASLVAEMEQQGPGGLAQGLRQTAARHRPLLLGLGVALALALYRQWPWWVALLAALGMAAPFAACALAWRHVLQHRQGLCAALAGDAMGLQESLQALTDAALRRPWEPGLREMAWELAFYSACMTARYQGVAAARAELLAHPCRPEAGAGGADAASRQPLGIFEYLLPARAGDFATAAAVLEGMLAAAPDRPEWLMDLAITRERLGQFDEARRLLARVNTQELPPFIAMYEQGIRGLLALDDARHADFGQAVALLTAACRTALEWTQRNPVFWWSAISFACELSLALARNGQPQAARRALATVRRLAPQCVDARRLEIIRAEVEPALPPAPAAGAAA